MKLSKYKQLIATLPVHQQAFTSKLSTWEKILGWDRVPKEFAELFSGNQSATISRKDIFDIASKTPQDIVKVIYSTILWGYPNGMRGNNFSGIVKGIDEITRVLSHRNIQCWKGYIQKIKKIDGLGLSTYSKFLYFLNITVEKYQPLILDRRLIKTFQKKIFDEFNNLSIIKYDNAPEEYVNYLKIINEEAKQLDVNSENIEMFLFMFGLNLKE